MFIFHGVTCQSFAGNRSIVLSLYIKIAHIVRTAPPGGKAKNHLCSKKNIERVIAGVYSLSAET